MKSSKEKAESHHILPEDFSRCVWMNAGLVAYKLCDQEFECEQCSFDVVMRGGLVNNPREVKPEIMHKTSGVFVDDRVYHPVHTWAQRIKGNFIRIGLDSFAAGLLRGAHSVILPTTGSLLFKGKVGCWFVVESTPVPVRLAVSGRIVRGNGILLSHPEAAIEDYYESGWLMEVECENAKAELDGLLTAAEMRKRSQVELKNFYQQANAHLNQVPDAVGKTLTDGGEKLADLRRMLGSKIYYCLLSKFLS